MTAISTAVYGLGSLLLAYQIKKDRDQREAQFKLDNDSRKLDELRTAFYEAYGYWLGHHFAVGSTELTASQVGKQFEALTRLECQLRLNGYKKEANDLGYSIRARLSDINTVLGRVGVALQLTPPEYRVWQSQGPGETKS